MKKCIIGHKYVQQQRKKTPSRFDDKLCELTILYNRAINHGGGKMTDTISLRLLQHAFNWYQCDKYINIWHKNIQLTIKWNKIEIMYDWKKVLNVNEACLTTARIYLLLVICGYKRLSFESGSFIWL